jgi:threonylcarbamoyladenosine tRNA methylthiotransferase MtaB
MEAQTLEATGALEIVLTDTQPGAYGRDRSDGTTAARLLSTLLADTTLPRIHYSSIQPQDVTDDFLAQWQDTRLCRHFHLALQSGSDAVLRRMRRRYTAADYLHALERIRAAVPGASITADVIAGFPGETDREFGATLAVCRDAAFADVHVFPYSARPTPPPTSSRTTSRRPASASACKPSRLSPSPAAAASARPSTDQSRLSSSAPAMVPAANAPGRA